VDNAGNREEARTAAFTIDYGAPSVELEVYTEPGLGVAYVKASDEASAVTLVEYRVNGGAVNAYTAPVVITSPGSYTVEARATDAAGWVSEWQSIGMEVKSIQESEWVSGLRFAYPYFGRGVVRNVGVGEHLFCPPRGRHNNIKALPSYIPGADFIRCAYTDRDYRGHAFIRFQAGVDCDVYVFKHKDSRADLRGWELVERDFPVEPAQYYRGGADVYRKRVARGDVVVIPGAEIRHGSGYGNLVFVQYAKDNLAYIVGPRPGMELSPLETVTCHAFVRAEGDNRVSWQVRYADGEWREAGTGPRAELSLPYTDDSLPMRLRLTVSLAATGTVLTDECEYVIVNRADVELVNPGPGTQVLCGRSVSLEYSALGLTGRVLPPGAVSFFVRRAGRGDEWAPCTDGILHVPDGPGELELKAVAVLAPGHSKEFGFKLRAVKEYTPVTILFGRASRRNDYSLGETVSTHKSGRVYGFEPDHSGRIVSFRAIKPFHFRTRFYAIKLLHDGEFLFYTGTGRFRVILTLGPVERRELAYVRIAGQRTDINGAAHKTAIFRVTRDVEVSDGILTIQGKEGLGLISLEVLKLSPDEAGPPTEQVERLDEYGILEHYGPPPRLRHDDKNDKNNKGRDNGRGKDKRSDVKGGGR